MNWKIVNKRQVHSYVGSLRAFLLYASLVVFLFAMNVDQTSKESFIECTSRLLLNSAKTLLELSCVLYVAVTAFFLLANSTECLVTTLLTKLRYFISIFAETNFAYYFLHSCVVDHLMKTIFLKKSLILFKCIVIRYILSRIQADTDVIKLLGAWQ